MVNGQWSYMQGVSEKRGNKKMRPKIYFFTFFFEYLVDFKNILLLSIFFIFGLIFLFPIFSETACIYLAARCYLYDIVSQGPVELNISQEAGVVAGGEAGLHDPLSVSQDVELRQSHVRGHLN